MGLDSVVLGVPGPDGARHDVCRSLRRCEPDPDAGIRGSAGLSGRHRCIL